ncbi:MAG TPA: pyrroline-5-carboxylate reductase [Miltoncostaeaceae bacterium]|nr:pyrroline-5-carboxylate reductase [Miltoncostaeaceae bacterium]
MSSAEHLTVGLLGAGAMGRALLAGMARGRPAVAANALICDTVPEAVAAAIVDVGGRAADPAQVAGADVICLAVKPGDVAGALDSLRSSVRADTIVVSVAAGWDLDRLSARLPGVALVRLMPNLAVRHGAGVVALAARDLPENARARLDELLAPLGAVVALPETLFPVATALAGSGPGLVALVAEALEEGAVGAGLGRSQAREMVAAVIAGTGALLADGGDPALLRQRVSSPGGTTVAGIAVLERGAVRAHVADALAAAARRAGEL